MQYKLENTQTCVGVVSGPPQLKLVQIQNFRWQISLLSCNSFEMQKYHHTTRQTLTLTPKL